MKEISPDLLDLLFHLNQKLETKNPFHVLSGYRSPKTNAALRRRNRNVARNSLHMEGMAVDLRVPELHAKHLCHAALDMQCGGVVLRPGAVSCTSMSAVSDLAGWTEEKKTVKATRKT